MGDWKSYLAFLAMLAVLLLSGPVRAGTIDLFPENAAVGPFGERTSLANNTSYVAQSFVPLPGLLTELQFVMYGQPLQPRNLQANTFHVLITETVGGTEQTNSTWIRPSNVLFESGDLTMPISSGDRQIFTVAIPSLALTPGATYAWVLDAFVTADGIPGESDVGAVTGFRNYLGGHHFWLGLNDSTAGMTRAEQFNRDWPDVPEVDLVFRMTFSEIPEPATLSLLGAGLIAFAGRGRRNRSRILLGVLALAMIGVPASAGTIDNMATITRYEGGFGEMPNVSYFGQVFTAIPGELTQVQFVLQQQTIGLQNVGDNEFRLLITGTTGTESNVHPTTVLFESGTLTMPLQGGTQTFTVAVPNLDLTDGASYAFLLDAYVEADLVPGKSAAGVNNTYADGYFIFQNTSSSHGNTRAQHFAGAWNVFGEDLAFRMNFTDPEPVPEPASLTLLASGLAALAARRRANEGVNP